MKPTFSSSTAAATSAVQAAITAAVAAAKANPRTVAPQTLVGGAVIRTDIYHAPGGQGFVVTCTLPNGIKFSQQSGPERRRAVSLQKGYVKALPLLHARAAKLASLTNALQSAITADFAVIAPQWQYVLAGVKGALIEDLASGNIANAIAAITFLPLPDPSLAGFQSDVLVLLNTYASLFEAAASAISVGAVHSLTATPPGSSTQPTHH